MDKQYDHITELETIQEVGEVKKFNPWHDARGRFASGPGGGGKFSANPKTKAGQNAIRRQYLASGGKRTSNVHRESKGETVYQNVRWLQTGRTPAVARRYNQQQASGGSKATNKPSSTATKPKTTSKPAASSQKPAASTNHKMANGKDITKSFTPKGTTKQEIMDEVARKQGFKGQGRVVTDKAEFENAVKKGGVVMYRTLGPGTDVISGQYKLPSDFAKMMKTGSEDELSLNGSGASYYGQGIYTASTKITPGKKPSARDQIEAADGSVGYAWAGAGKTVAMTLDPSAKVGKYDDLYEELLNAPASEIRKFGTDVGAYAAAKGYDALTEDVGGGVYYTMVYNRTKVIFYDAEYDNYKSSRGHKNSPESF